MFWHIFGFSHDVVTQNKTSVHRENHKLTELPRRVITNSRPITQLVIVIDCTNYTLKHTMLLRQSTRQMIHNNTEYFYACRKSKSETDHLFTPSFININGLYYLLKSITPLEQNKNLGSKTYMRNDAAILDKII